MQFPEEFKTLLGQFHIHFFDVDTPEESVASALILVGKKRREKIKDFLDEVLSKPYDAEEALKQWWSSPADIKPRNAEQIDHIFKLIRKLLDSEKVQHSPVP